MRRHNNGAYRNVELGWRTCRHVSCMRHKRATDTEQASNAADRQSHNYQAHKSPANDCNLREKLNACCRPLTPGRCGRVLSVAFHSARLFVCSSSHYNSPAFSDHVLLKFHSERYKNLQVSSSVCHRLVNGIFVVMMEHLTESHMIC